MNDQREEYCDGFVLPIKADHINEYKSVADQVAKIWKEYGALEYKEFIGDDMHLEGTMSFIESAKAKENELVIFGWVVFPSKDVRDDANEKVPKDPRMTNLVAPLMDPDRLIFDAGRMIYGGFKSLVNSEIQNKI